jgi:hypothetical protein
MGTMLNVANSIIDSLKEKDIDAYLWHKATTGSVYIRFKDNRLGSIRIGDHKGISKYKYKYNIRCDITFNGWKKDNGVWRFYTNISSYEKVIDEIVKKANFIKENSIENKYSYAVPEFKRKKEVV